MEMKRRGKIKRRWKVPKIFFSFLDAKKKKNKNKKKNQTSSKYFVLVPKILYWFKKFGTGLKILYWFKNFVLVQKKLYQR